MNRDELGGQAEQWVNGYNYGLAVGKGHRTRDRYQWGKLAFVVVAGSCLGSLLGLGMLYWITL